MSVARGRPAWLWLAAAALPVLLLAVAMRLDGDLVDDAYIFCRYADRMLAGQGLTFNPGERVEGFTSPLHLLLVAAGAASGLEAPQAAWWGALLAGALVLLLLARHRPAEAATSGIVAALLTLAWLPFALWSASGMDTALFALVALAAALGLDRELARDPALPPRPRTWLLLGATTLVRPEGLALVAAGLALAAPRLVLPPRRLRRLPVPLLAFVPFALLTLARLAYFDAWLPNTYYAKASGGGPQQWARGLGYTTDAAIGLLPLLLAALPAIASGLIRRRPDVPSTLALALAAAVTVEGGDHFPLHRLLVPAAPLLALAAARGLAIACSAIRLRAAAAAGLVAATAAWSLAAPAPFRAFAEPPLERYHFEVRAARTWDLMGGALRERFGPGQRIALSNVGAIPYRSGWETVDLVGLTDAHIARLARPTGQGFPGHEKFDSAYVLARRPTLVLLHTWLWTAPGASAETLGRLGLDAHRDLYADPGFARDYRLDWVPVADRFAAVYVRRSGDPGSPPSGPR